jgi:hypothetical protein
LLKNSIPNGDFPLVVTVYTDLACGHPDGEGFVELTTAEPELRQNSLNTFEYEIALPINSNAETVTYYFSASAPGYTPVPDLVLAEVSDRGEPQTIPEIELIPVPAD